MNETRKAAPKGKFRVIGVDIFSHEDYKVGDYSTFAEARDVAVVARTRACGRASGPDIADRYYVYNDQGQYIG